MTEQQIIEWAREAKAARDGSLFLFYVEDLQCFASLVAAHAKAEEREQCANEADKRAKWLLTGGDLDGWFPSLEDEVSADALNEFAAAIRALKD